MEQVIEKSTSNSVCVNVLAYNCELISLSLETDNIYPKGEIFVFFFQFVSTVCPNQPWQWPVTTNLSKSRSCNYSLEAPADER